MNTERAGESENGEDAASRRQNLSEYPLRRKVLVSALLLILSGSLLNALFGARGLFGLMKARENLADLQSEIRSLEETNGAMRGEIQALRENPMAIERRAREILGMSRPEETVIIIRRPD